MSDSERTPDGRGTERIAKRVSIFRGNFLKTIHDRPFAAVVLLSLFRRVNPEKATPWEKKS
jgi:hypothetical protein